MRTLLKVQWHAEAWALDYILLKVRRHAEACAVMRIWLSAAQGYGGIPLRPAHAQHTASGSDLWRNGVKVTPTDHNKLRRYDALLPATGATQTPTGS
jgi:hypothetical protein